MIPSICLSIVVKNDSKIITRLLDSVISIIDNYCICYVGDNDNTKEIIIEYFANKHINGNIIELPFIDKGYNKTKTYEVSRKMADYVLFMDSDEVAKIDPLFDKKNLSHDTYLIKTTHNSLTNYKHCLIKSTINAVCEGYVFERWNVDTIDNEEHAVHIHFNKINDSEFYNNDILENNLKLLKQEIEDYPGRSRCQFYLAKTYCDMGDLKNAEIEFNKRIKMGGNIEEISLSYNRIGICKLNQKADITNAVGAFLKSYQYCPNRAESIYEITRGYRQNGNFQLAEMNYNLGKTIKLSKKDTLLIQNEIYDYLFEYEYMIFKFYTENNKTTEFMIDMCKRVQFILNNCHDSRTYDNVVSNLKYYHPVLPSTGKKVKVNDLHVKDYWSNKMYVCTPSVVRFKTDKEDCYYFNQKYVNYTMNLKDKVLNYVPQNQHITKNRLIKYDKNFNIVKDTMIEPKKLGDNYHILGDLKLFQYGEDLWAIGTSTSSAIGEGYVEVFCGKYDSEKEMYNYDIIPSPKFVGKIEKNWVLFENNEKLLKVVYGWFPIEIGSIQNSRFNSEKIINPPNLFKYVSGSSPGCIDPVNTNHVWFVTHFRDRDMPLWYLTNYMHMLVVLDRTTYEIVKYSIPFKFKGALVEFCLGIVVDKDEILISFSKDENRVYLLGYDRKLIEDKYF